MPRSRLYPFAEDIADALLAGTSVRALARTYGVDHTTLMAFIGRWLPEHASAAQQARAADRHAALPRCQYLSLRTARTAVERSRQRAEEAYI